MNTLNTKRECKVPIRIGNRHNDNSDFIEDVSHDRIGAITMAMQDAPSGGVSARKAQTKNERKEGRRLPCQQLIKDVHYCRGGDPFPCMLSSVVPRIRNVNEDLLLNLKLPHEEDLGHGGGQILNTIVFVNVKNSRRTTMNRHSDDFLHSSLKLDELMKRIRTLPWMEVPMEGLNVAMLSCFATSFATSFTISSYG